MTTDGLSGFPHEWATALVDVALREDLGPDGVDVTTLATIPADQMRTAEIVARAPGVVAGVPVIALVLAAVAERVGGDVPSVEVVNDDGARLERGDVIARLAGPTQVILVAERTILNILSRLSGVATHTRRWADALDGTSTMVLDTRKTTPGLRWLEKYAVRCGGGTNKRMGLYDVAMIKDNHKLAAGSVAAAYALVRERFPARRRAGGGDHAGRGAGGLRRGGALHHVRQHVRRRARARRSSCSAPQVNPSRSRPRAVSPSRSCGSMPARASTSSRSGA